MANSKISALTSATTPLAGTETLPVVQSNTTKQVSVANLTAGRNVDVNKITTADSASFAANKYHYINTLPIFAGDGVNTNYLFSGATNLVWRNAADSATLLVLTNSTGNFTVNTGNLVIGTAGKGIDFSANSHAAGMTSELLNWYEEGTWTPTISNQTNCTITNSATKRYTRIGNSVVVNVAFNYSSTGGVASFQFTLPFTAASSYGISTLGFGYPDVIRWGVRSGDTTKIYCLADVASTTNHDINISFAYQVA